MNIILAIICLGGVAIGLIPPLGIILGAAMIYIYNQI